VRAPGGPGAATGWGPGRKQAFGTAPGRQSRVWFTIADGNLSEVFYPAVDQPVLLGLRFMVAAPGSPPVDDASEADHQVRWLEPGVPCFQVESRHLEYVLTTTFVTDPGSDALVISGDFRPEMPDIRLYLQASPHEIADGAVLPRDPPALVARQGESWMALLGPFSRCSVGYLNSSDLLVDLHDNDGAMTAEYESAAGGSIALGAELGFASGPFHLAIGFGDGPEAAESAARGALDTGAARLRQEFVDAWHATPSLPPNVLKVAGDGGELARCSLAVLRSLEDKRRPGAFVAAPTAAWAIAEQSYARVWTRHLYHIATALLDAGDVEAARRALRYLEATQREDGSWPQSMTVQGRACGRGLELDEVALPILLCWRLGVAGALDHDPYPTLVGPAAAFLLANGPGTPLDRWEDAGGLSPSTLATAIAALAVAAAFADEAGEEAASDHLIAAADCWNDRLEVWTYLRTFRHYVRLGLDLEGVQRPEEGGIGVEFIELVRRGLRQAADPRIQSSLVTADAPLRVQLGDGPVWRRHTGDLYGESDDGRPWAPDRPGKGRPWPLLSGERGHLALANGEPVAEYVLAMEACAGPELILPEQIWDGRDMPFRGLVRGRATGGAAPLGWTHAEYLKLLIAFATSELPDRIEPVRRRYASQPPASPAIIWSQAHPVRTAPEGRTVRIQVGRPAEVVWTPDGGAISREAQTYDTRLGFWVADLPLHRLRPGTVVQWTLRYADGSWDAEDYQLRIVPKASPTT
jgi:glucoamylase